MLFSKEIEGLHDDGFQGSINDRDIFTEVFFGNDHDRTSKRCLVTGAINFECDYSKQADKLLCSNGENSTITSQVDSCNVKDDSREYSGPGCLSEGRALSMRKDHDVNNKRIKLSIDGSSYSRESRPYSEAISNWSPSLKRVVSSMFVPDSQFVCRSVTGRIVESSNHGATSSCYLLRQQAGTSSRSNMSGRDVSNLRLLSLDGIDKKEASASKAIASPVSQESFATKLLVTSPPASAANKSSKIRKPVQAKILSNRESIKDPRPLLRNHMQILLRAAGWEIGSHRRLDRSNGSRFSYLSPQGGKPIREFYKAWNLCGQTLFGEGSVIVQEEGKQWADMTDFWSDLSITLCKIKEELSDTETTAALARRWCLLDPFVNMALVEKKWGGLRAGKVVKARKILLLDTPAKDDGSLSLKILDGIENQSVRHSPDCIHDSSLARGGMLTTSEGNNHDCNENCGDEISAIVGQLHNGTVKALKGVSIHLHDEKYTEFRNTVIGTGTRHGEISGNKRVGQDLNSLQAFGADGTWDHSSNLLFDVPMSVENVDIKLGGSETVSPHRDSGRNSIGGDRHRSDHDEVMVSEVDEIVSMGSSEGGDRSVCRKATDKAENQLKGSLDNHLNCRNDGLSQFDDQDSYLPLSTCLASVSSRPLVGEDSQLVFSYNTGFRQHAGLSGKVHGQCIEASKFEMNSIADAILKRKDLEKSKTMFEIKVTTLHRNDRLNLSANKAEGHEIDENSIQSHSGEIRGCLTATNVRSGRICEKSRSRKRRCSKKLVKFSHHNAGEATQDMKSEVPGTQNKIGSATCQLKDDDLLISAVIKTKNFRSITKPYTPSKKSYKSEAVRKRKSQKGRCGLLPRSMVKGGKHMEEKWYIFGPRTVLSWLIESGVISLNEVIQYRNPKNESVVKDGLVTRDGILCKCCNKTLSVSEFKSHAGFRLNRPCMNLVMESGKPFTLCQLEAWSTEYKARKRATQVVQVEEMDQNDDSCGLCGDGGELICCDNCPSTFHQACFYVQSCLPHDSHCITMIDDMIIEEDEDDGDMEMFTSSENRISDLPDYEELPEGNWYCSNCTCRICGDVVHDKEASKSPSALKCSQCENKYHEACVKGKGPYRQVASDTWFCGESCQEVYLGLQSYIGLVNPICDGFSWTLLRCIHGDQRVHSAQRFVALKAECNSKLAVALTIMEECFLSMVDPRTGIDMIPHVVYNWGSEFARLNYHGFYTMVLEKDDVLMSVASIRIHGVTVAEMPLIATCSLHRRQGMCRRLMNSIQEMLRSFKVEKLVISAIPSLVETWTLGFGFQPLEADEKRSLSNINLMVFPGTVWLKKPIFGNQETCQQGGSGHATPLSADDPTETGACSKGGGPTGDDFARQSDGSPPRGRDAAPTATEHTGGNDIQLEKVQDGHLPEHFSKLSCEELGAMVGVSQLEMVCNVESVVTIDEKEKDLTADEQSQKADMLQDKDK